MATAAIWQGRNIGLQPSPPSSLASNFSPHSKHAQASYVTSASTVYNAMNLPFDQWVDTPVFPDAPTSHAFQIIGITNASATGLGALNLYMLGKEAGKAQKRNDTKGVGYCVAEGMTATAQIGVGVSSTLFRTSCIADVVTSADGQNSTYWGSLSNQSGLASGLLSGIVYAGMSIVEAAKAYESYSFKSQLDTFKTESEKIKFLKNRLNGDDEGQASRVDAVARKNIAAQAEAMALQEQTEVMKGHIETMRKYKICDKDFVPNQEKLEQLVRSRMSQPALEEHGQKLMAERLKTKRLIEMNRILGTEAVKELQNPISKIELSKIEVSHAATRKKYRNKALFFLGGALLTISLAIVAAATGGTALLVLSAVMIAVYIREMYMAYKRIQEMDVEDASAPGKYDKGWPIGSIILSVASIAATIVLCSTIGLPLVPLIFSFALALLMIGMNCMHYRYIGKREEQFLEKLLNKTNLQPPEFSYIAERGSKTQIEKAYALLNVRDRKGVDQFLQLPQAGETIQHFRKRYLKAIEQWLEENHKLYLQRLAGELRIYP